MAFQTQHLGVQPRGPAMQPVTSGGKFPVQQGVQPGGQQLQAQAGLPPAQLGVQPGGQPIQAQQPNPYYGAVPQQQQYVPPTGLIGSERALQGGLQGALGGLYGGLQQGRGEAYGMVQSGIGGAMNQINTGAMGLQPWAQQGQAAQGRQGNLSGANGAAAQAAAFQSFMDSPEQAHLRERGEQAVTRNAAALGGLGGGRVQQELQRQGVGLAAQDFQNQYDRLGFLSGQGLQAQGQIGQLYGQGANITGQLSGIGANLAGAFGRAQAAGSSALWRGTGQDLAMGRTRAGEQIAGNIGGTTSALAGLQNQQGIGLSGMYDTSGGNLAGILSGAGMAQGQDQTNLAGLLSGNALTQSGQVAGLPGMPGTQQSNTLGQIGQLASGIGTAAAAYYSDVRLKTNIQPAGVTPGGVPLYTWDWNAEGERVASGQPTRGVIAQEVPWATQIEDNGYLTVDYSRIT